MKTIPLTQGVVAVVDDEDFDKVNQFKWRLLRLRRTSYAQRNLRINGKRTMQYLHRFVLDLNPGDPDIDHRDGNGLNCTRDNLRKASRQQNECNQRKQLRKTSSRYKGVYWRRGKNKWGALIQVNDKKKHLGSFDSEQEAARAYNQAAIQLHGDFARLNEVK